MAFFFFSLKNNDSFTECLFFYSFSVLVVVENIAF